MTRHCEERSDEVIQLLFSDNIDGLLHGACHRARIRATRWLAMTESTDIPVIPRCAIAHRGMTVTTERESHVLLRRYCARLPPDSRQPHRNPHQGRGALQGEEHPARGVARRAALSGYPPTQKQDPVCLPFRGEGLRAAHA